MDRDQKSTQDQKIKTPGSLSSRFGEEKKTDLSEAEQGHDLSAYSVQQKIANATYIPPPPYSAIDQELDLAGNSQPSKEPINIKQDIIHWLFYYLRVGLGTSLGLLMFLDLAKLAGGSGIAGSIMVFWFFLLKLALVLESVTQFITSVWMRGSSKASNEINQNIATGISVGVGMAVQSILLLIIIGLAGQNNVAFYTAHYSKVAWLFYVVALIDIALIGQRLYKYAKGEIPSVHIDQDDNWYKKSFIEKVLNQDNFRDLIRLAIYVTYIISVFIVLFIALVAPSTRDLILTSV
ncbi:hypothetical protein NEHOM01_2015 [Nematocida homosporus]|uniref:uncharacterized protein n=1 Tax=Nematocida homosporus TaxID=1912981 RepID=UPI00221E9B47|nr:uncharacterized protein NEHOM01_2015 [Nematocida homosporus]KAI5187217.1 hypothetical protein NEHOM01_2015 [Nematocida homosporus]